ncbi:unnamed protein product, partial [marine sediment metagenome]
CGFQTLNDYRGRKDLYGKKLKVTQVNIAEALAASAVFEMGEGAEQTPLCLLTDIDNITFQNKFPTKKEIASFIINPEEDIYYPLLTSVDWKRSSKK